MKNEREIAVLPTTQPDTFLVVTCYYTKGGMNYFTGNVEERGYYLSATPEKRSGGIRTFTAFSGTKVPLRTVARFNKREFENLLIPSDVLSTVKGHVLAKNNLTLKDVAA